MIGPSPILKSFFPRTDYMQGLPDMSFGPFHWLPEDEELCVQPVVFVPKIAIRSKFLGIHARATLLQMLGGHPSWSTEKTRFNMVILQPLIMWSPRHRFWKRQLLCPQLLPLQCAMLRRGAARWWSGGRGAWGALQPQPLLSRAATHTIDRHEGFLK